MDVPSHPSGSRRSIAEPSPPSWRRPLRTAAVLMALLLPVGACFGGPEGGGTGIEEPDEWTVRVHLSNVGDGFGTVVVTFSAGEVDNPCPEPLGPDQSCTVEAQHTSAISRVDIDVDPGASSDFKGYSGACSGDGECVIQVAGESDISYDIQVDLELVVNRIDFDPDPVAVAAGADASVTASAWADDEGTVPVENADFTWSSADPAVATVEATTSAGATVSGGQTGETWIRAASRGTTDSVRVVVGG